VEESRYDNSSKQARLEAGPMPSRAKVVVAYLDGRRLKGYTNDFSPARDHFFLFPDGVEPKPGDRGTSVRIVELKALFFVKDFAGDQAHTEVPGASPLPGKRIESLSPMARN
jgi:hypothetical protein